MAAHNIIKKFAKVLNKVADAAEAIYQMYASIKKDIAQGTIRNTVETAAKVAGGWAGRCAGMLFS